MNHGTTTDEVERIVELEVTGREDEARQILGVIGDRYEEQVLRSRAEDVKKLHDMENRWQKRLQRTTMLAGSMGGMVAAFWICFGYHLRTDDTSITMLVLSIFGSFILALTGAQIGKFIAR